MIIPKKRYNTYPLNLISILGIECQCPDIRELNHIISNLIQSNDKAIIANFNLHNIYLFHRFSKMKKFYNLAKYKHIDGMSLVIWAYLMGYPIDNSKRVTYVDWLYLLIETATKNDWSIFYLGTTSENLSIAVKRLKKSFNNLRIQTHHGFFNYSDQKENDAVIQKINSFKPDILMVGMGSCLQELWILDHYSELDTHVILQCGACFDYIAGALPTPPRRLAKWGLEGICRVIYEPRRLWKRIFVEPLLLSSFFFKDIKKRVIHGYFK